MLRLPHDLERLPALFDERSQPDFRVVFGRLSARSTWMDVAVTRVRLTTLDLRTEELAQLRRLRLLVAEVNALTLDREAHALLVGGPEGQAIRHLGTLLERGVIHVRAAPLGGWSPDFTVFGDQRGPRALLLGFHWFQRPYPHRGPALASVHGARAALLAAQRFEGVWNRAHDIRPALLGILAGRGASAIRSPHRPPPSRCPATRRNPSCRNVYRGPAAAPRCLDSGGVRAYHCRPFSTGPRGAWKSASLPP